MSAIENLSEIIKREVQVSLYLFAKGIFAVLKEDCPNVDLIQRIMILKQRSATRISPRRLLTPRILRRSRKNCPDVPMFRKPRRMSLSSSVLRSATKSRRTYIETNRNHKEVGRDKYKENIKKMWTEMDEKNKVKKMLKKMG
jgi:hypothetical protein